MAYRVKVAPAALQDAQDAIEWMEERSPKHAAAWFKSLLDAILSLEEMPRRCSFAPENAVYFREVRHLLYVKRRITYRILFIIVQEETEQEEGLVRVLRVRHGAQQILTANQVARGEQD